MAAPLPVLFTWRSGLSGNRTLASQHPRLGDHTTIGRSYDDSRFDRFDIESKSFTTEKSIRAALRALFFAPCLFAQGGAVNLSQGQIVFC